MSREEAAVGFKRAPDFIRGMCYGEARSVGYEWAKVAWRRILQQAGYSDIDGPCKSHSEEAFCTLSAEMSRQIGDEMAKYMDGNRHDHLPAMEDLKEPSDTELSAQWNVGWRTGVSRFWDHVIGAD